MIVSHRHRFVFFAVPRTGTHAIRRALAPHLDAGDWQQKNLHGAARLPVPELAAIEHGHIGVDEARRYLPAEIWNGYLKFAFVRNPFDRFVSACFFLHRNQSAFAQSPVEHMKRALRRAAFRRRVLVRSQVAQLALADGTLGVDRIGRFETLEDSLAEIGAELGLPPLELARMNASTHEGYAKHYDAELRQHVAELYAEDLRAFGYAFDADPA